ncbi:alkaline shock response membrane anchor protein AmaP [Streptomyces luteolus]|uniref:Alkaline shock response membrane anchor protein AmaP n=1 Tax=Streptomyces luteolus TaxID=3043615 RepID=A0ABT6T697_9ACTN|nr:alkaline shock response membrane anchor protein AmaP [Streptomyces sp. B-S-A12]MDI3423407.1 alkaline shock response membrane anchor protein AmaP [Streptomyces sp. B-S-A12]
MLRTVNRVLLALVSLILLLLGGTVLATGLGAPMPSWWVYDGRDDVLLSDADRARWRDESWFWPVVIAVLAVLVLLALWWLVAQTRRGRLAEVLVDSGDGEGALLRGRALEDVLARETEVLDGVEQVRVRLKGRRSTPHAGVRMLLAPHAEPSVALRLLTADSLAQARTSTGLDRLPAEVRMRGVKHRARRVS